eukprot:14093680-Alexandrium_andersonii.AAC.1
MQKLARKDREVLTFDLLSPFSPASRPPSSDAWVRRCTGGPGARPTRPGMGSGSSDVRLTGGGSRAGMPPGTSSLRL